MTSPARLLSLLVLLLASLPGVAAPLPAPAGKSLTVYFFDVGQGDAALIVSPTGKTVLIDGGPPEAREHLTRRLKELVKEPLDLVILTHPHLDHLGGLTQALRAVGAKRFMDPGFDHASDAYRDLLSYVGGAVGQVMTPEPSAQAPHTLLTIGLGEGTSLTVLWPRVPQEPFLDNTRSDPNSNSIVAKLTYGKTAFLFTGDAEPDTEAALLRKPIDFSSTVLKVAHHGGRHSSTAAFLAEVKPKAAVISCGAGNDYGHPTAEALERLDASGARVFRTDVDGEVVAVSDGTSVTLRARKGRAAPLVVPGTVKPGPVALGPILPGTQHVRSGTRAKEPEPASRAGSATTRGPSETPSPSRAAAEEGRFISLKGSKVFHSEDCRTLKRSKSERTVYPSRAAALSERRPAEDCHP
ncbi:ComEC/Rec2 family competence protein [Pyxidicoccus trucidator]|uniref:ComEC/Rec2 family competence protein n=1 Tax=Pyxidicoccus trucidator TaxID=2709662 RepID=UPI0013D9159D|nr:ComEC/Rec2 family competence protein [Pyxidicoccus trucidator]